MHILWQHSFRGVQTNLDTGSFEHRRPPAAGGHDRPRRRSLEKLDIVCGPPHPRRTAPWQAQRPARRKQPSRDCKPSVLPCVSKPSRDGKPSALPCASKPSRDGTCSPEHPRSETSDDDGTCNPEDPRSETSDDNEHAAAQGNYVHSCICCFHWINRRQDCPITLIPMQSLLYFMLTVTSSDHKKCDKRVFNRLTKSIGEEQDNFWRSIFSCQELKAIEYINQKRESCLHTGDDFCIKREFAGFYHVQNGGGILLASSSITDLIRSTHPPLL